MTDDADDYGEAIVFEDESVSQYADQQFQGDANQYEGEAEDQEGDGGIFIDENGRYVDAEGRYVDEYGRLVDEEGQLIEDTGIYVDEDGRYVDAEGRYVDEHGRYVDENGEYIDEEGQYIDENGQYVDENGQPLDENGQYVDENGQYVDENGQYVDENGQYVDENGQYVDENGQYVDENGQYVDENGQYVDQDGQHVEEGGQYADGGEYVDGEGGYADEDVVYADQDDGGQSVDSGPPFDSGFAREPVHAQTRPFETVPLEVQRPAARQVSFDAHSEQLGMRRGSTKDQQVVEEQTEEQEEEVQPPTVSTGTLLTCVHLTRGTSQIQTLKAEGPNKLRCWSNGRPKLFEADTVFVQRPKANPAEAYTELGEPLVQDALDGYDVLLLECGRRPRSFGSTGEGEMAHMCCNALAHGARQRMVSDPSLTIQIWMSYLEIYNEEVHDLLEGKKPYQPFLTPLKVHGGREQLVEIPNLSTHDILAYGSINQLVVFGNSQRAWDTKGPEPLARSHTILAMRILRRQQMEDGSHVDSMNMLHCVDLAGFQWRPKAEVRWQQEARCINASLQVLCRTLQNYPKGYLPARDSKLTQILSSSLGPNSRIVFIAHVSPDAVHRTEALAALSYVESLRKKPVAPTADQKENTPADNLVDPNTGKKKKPAKKAAWSPFWSERHLPQPPPPPEHKSQFRREVVISRRQQMIEAAARGELKKKKNKRPEWNRFFGTQSVAIEKTSQLAPLVKPSFEPPPLVMKKEEERRRKEEQKDIDELDAEAEQKAKKKVRPPWNMFFTKGDTPQIASPTK